MTSLAKLLNHTAVVKRYTRSSGRGTGSSTTVIASLPITQPVSIDYNTAQRVGTTHRTILQEPFKFRMVLFENDRDVQQGDVMTINAGSTEYPVRHVEKWPYVLAGETRMVAILEYDVRDG